MRLPSKSSGVTLKIVMHVTCTYLLVFLHIRSQAPNLAIAPNVQPGGPGVSIFVHLLYSAHESIQRAAAGVLAEVSLDRDGLDALANLPGASTRFNELVHSRNEAIATYASAVVIRLTEERKVTSGTACMFPPHVEVLNTPPLPMDMGGPIQAPQIQQAPPIGGACPLSSMSHSTWSHQFSPGPMSQDPMHAASSPPPNSLTEMLGPPPAAYKGSTCTGYCGYWSDCGSVGGCSDPNCIYMEHCGPSYCGVSPIRPVRPDTLSTVPVYPHCGSTYAPQGSHPIPLDPGLSTNNPPPVVGSTTLTLGGGTASTRKSGYTSLDTSGYMSPSNEMYMPQPSSTYKPVSNVPLMRHSRAAAVLPVQTNSAESSSSPVITSGTGYLSPELMSLDDPNSDWLTNQNLL
ncbi:Beta catenin [Fasciola hepatica]|uniref:Beta catenin n=1 Tax=Fasciola hepatica TaxID=6192 RepID=A0A4E0R0V1_FASHE|nr:Beta catenin [Fasciola hepatica]